MQSLYSMPYRTREGMFVQIRPYTRPRVLRHWKLPWPPWGGFGGDMQAPHPKPRASVFQPEFTGGK